MIFKQCVAEKLIHFLDCEYLKTFGSNYTKQFYLNFMYNKERSCLFEIDWKLSSKLIDYYSCEVTITPEEPEPAMKEFDRFIHYSFPELTLENIAFIKSNFKTQDRKTSDAMQSDINIRIKYIRLQELGNCLCSFFDDDRLVSFDELIKNHAFFVPQCSTQQEYFNHLLDFKLSSHTIKKTIKI